MLLDDSVHGCQPEARALADALGREERLEQVRLNLRAHADSGVAHAEHRVGPGAGAGMRLDEGVVEVDVAGLDRKPSALRHRVAGVHREVEDDLLDLRRVGLHAAEGRIEQAVQLDRLADQRPEHLGHAGDDTVQVEHARLEHLLAAEREELLGQ